MDLDRAIRRHSPRSWPTSSTSPTGSTCGRHYAFGTVGDRRRLRRALRDVGGAHLDRWTAHRADFLLCATGCLSAVNRPDLPGIEDFAGEVYYTAAWPGEAPDFSGKHVGAHRHRILGHPGGTDPRRDGCVADGVPALAELQRADAEPAMDRRRRADASRPSTRSAAVDPPTRRRAHPHTSPAKPAAETGPDERAEALWQRWSQGGVLFSKTFPDQLTDMVANDIAREFAEDRIRELVSDPAVADDLIPVDHPIGTKRICTDTGYYETFNHDHVNLVNLRREPIVAITADAVRTVDADHPCDALVFATGFDAMTGALSRIDPVGPDGDRLSDLWSDGPVTFLGLMIPQAAEPVQFQRTGQPVGVGQHGAARRGSGRLGD